MIYRIIIQNFRSFKNRVELSLIPDDESLHTAYASEQYPTLRDAVIYGANASGKSNIIKAIDFLKDIVQDNDLIAISKNQAFRLDPKMLEAPSLFVIEIRLKDYIYQYGVVFHFQTSSIWKEWLKAFNIQEGKWMDVYICQQNGDKNDVQFNVSEENPNRIRYDIYREDFGKQNQKLILSEIASKELDDQECSYHINRVFEWFDQLSVIFPQTSYNLLGALAKDKNAVNELYSKYFNYFDIDIEEIRLKNVPSNLLHLPDKLVTQIKKDLQSSRKERNFAMLHGNKDFLAQLDKRGELRFSEVTFVHKLNNYQSDFELQDESDGTQRLFDLIPMIGYLVNSDKVVLIDEIDRSLHTLLTRRLLQKVLSPNISSASQLILTTHDVLLMDPSVIGKREIWFVDKRKKVSNLYPLDQFKFDAKLDITANYLLGRFKAIPEY